MIVILSPPRSSSTALARVFWEHPEVGFYSHEPFDLVYYRNGQLREVFDALNKPIELKSGGRGLLIKEMTFQIGDHIDILANMSSFPIIFNFRDPRLSIMSRMIKREQEKGERNYPFVESGWSTLTSQISFCKQRGIPFVLLESSMYRNNPLRILHSLFRRLNLSFSPKMLEWKPKDQVNFGGVAHEQRVYYRRVLKSRKLEPAREPVPVIEDFPPYFQEHVKECLDIYRGLLKEEALIRPEIPDKPKSP